MTSKPPPSFSSFPSRRAPDSSNAVASSSKSGEPSSGKGVPSFTSFPAKARAPSPEERVRRRDKDEDRDRKRRRKEGESGKNWEKERERDRENGRREKRDKHGHRDRHDEDRKDRKRRDGEGIKKEKTENEEFWKEMDMKVQQNPTPKVAPKGYEIDIRGEPDNLRYGRPDSYKVPRYRLLRLPTVIGLPDNLRVIEQMATGKGLVVAPKEYAFAAQGVKPSRHSAYLSSEPALKLRSSEHSGPTAISGQESFIPLSKPKKRGLKDRDELPAHRKIYKEASPSSEESSEDEGETEEDVVEEETLDGAIRRRTKEFEVSLRENPVDVPKWIEYSKLHLTSSSVSSGKRTSGEAKAAKKAELEVSISILDRALSHHPNRSSAELHLAHLAVLAEIWPARQVTAKWRAVVRSLAEETGSVGEEGMMSVWLGYISWREGRGLGSGTEEGGGGVDEVVEVYEEALGSVREILVGNPSAGIEENGVYLILRGALFLKKAGHAERALSILQAMLELTFFQPPVFATQYIGEPNSAFTTRQMTGLEAFWDSEAPRIGEDGAVGWRAWYIGGQTPGSIETPSVDKPEFPPTMDPYVRWYLAEAAADKAGRRPTRVTDVPVEGEEDPYSSVVFSDISPFLIRLQSDSAKLQLIYATLLFLGLPFTPAEADTNAAFISDPCLVGHIDTAQFWPEQVVGKDGELTRESPGEVGEAWECPVRCWAQGEGEGLFEGARGWFGLMKVEEVVELDVAFCKNLFGLMRTTLFDPAFTAGMLAIEFAANKKSSLKTAKTLLSKERTNLPLWANYASMLSTVKGKSMDVRQVYITCLSSDIKTQVVDQLELFAGWAEFEWLQDQRGRCLGVIVAAIGEGGSGGGLAHLLEDGEIQDPSPPIMLRAKQYFATLSIPSPFPTIKLATLFEYFVNGIEAAVDFAQRYLAHANETAIARESVYQLVCRLIHVHSQNHATKPAIMRDFLEQAIALYPNNTIFLSMYLAGEQTSRVYGRVQKMLYQNGVDEPSPVRSLWSVWAEAQMASRTFWSGSGAERVRSALNRAIEDSSARRCDLVWMLFIEFEVHQRRFSAAKSLCYRAISELAGCKALYAMPFSPLLRPHFSPKELQDWADVMVERGLRVRVPFEKHFSAAGLLRDDMSDGEGSVVGPDDEYAFLQERKALMPY